jgi:hypothetical protein
MRIEPIDVELENKWLCLCYVMIFTILRYAVEHQRLFLANVNS